MNATFRRGVSAPGPMLSGSAGTYLLATLPLIAAIYLLYKQNYGLLITLAVISFFLILNRQSKSLALLGIIGFLVALGDIRRVATEFTGSRGLDPLLLVGAGCALYYATPLLLRVKLKDNLSKAVLAVMVVMVLQIFNPRQGSLLIGFTGVLFTLIPICWFWIGRRYGSDQVLFRLFFRVLAVLGVLGAILAIGQTFIGFFPWEEAWARAQGSYQLSHAGNLRAFGFSNSAQEYGSLMLMTAAITIGAAIGGRRAYLLALPVVVTAMVLSASRGPLVHLIFGAAMMWALRGRSRVAWIPRLIFALILGIGLLSYSATQAASSSGDSLRRTRSTASVASDRVAQGLAHPFDEKRSTGGSHVTLIVQGITEGFTNPIGRGLGANGLAGGKFTSAEDAVVRSSEVDISDEFSTLGFVGGLLYTWVIFCAFQAIPGFVQSGTPLVRLTTVGLLAAFLGGWIANGQYGTGPIVWFCVGALAKSIEDKKTRDLRPHEDSRTLSEATAKWEAPRAVDGPEASLTTA